MKQIRYWWWLAAAFFLKHRKTIAAASVLSAAALVLWMSLAPDIKFVGGKKSRRIGIVGQFSLNGLPPEILEKIGLGLTKIAEDGAARPGLAASWEIKEGGTEYLLRIDPSIKWHDGSSLKASEALVKIENVAVEAVDDQTIAFKLKEPYAPFLTLLARPIFKKDYWGTGSYRIQKVARNGEFVKKLELVSDRREKYIYYFYRTSLDLISAFKLGEVSQMNNLTSLDNVPDWKGLIINETINYDRVSAVYFNTKDQRLADKTFRQALSYAIPGKSSGERRALSPISPKSWAYNPQVKPYETNLEIAREMLAGSLTNGEKPKLELSTTIPFLEPAEEIARSWSQLGIETSVKVITAIPDDFQVLLIGRQRPPDPDQYSFWHSTQKGNITHFSNPKIDKLLEDGRKTSDQKKRAEIYRDFQRFLLEESPAAFLDHISTYTVSRK